MKKIMIFFSATLLMSSCGLYNKYERPDNVQTQGLIRDVVSDGDTLAVAPQDTASFGNLPWRSVFTDPQLTYRYDSDHLYRPVSNHEVVCYPCDGIVDA